MKTHTVPILILIGLLANVAAGQQEKRTTYGIGLSSMELTTSWYYVWPDNYYSPPRYSYYWPWHVHKRLQLLGYIEKPLRMRPFGLELSWRNELAVGILGGAKEDWLPYGETISSGGSSVSINGIIRAGLPLNFLPPAIQLFTGFGLTFSYVSANGEGIPEDGFVISRYRYDDGWQETMIGGFLPVGAVWDGPFGEVSLEVRLPLGGAADTDWDPVGWDVDSEDGAFYWAMVLSVGLGR